MYPIPQTNSPFSTPIGRSRPVSSTSGSYSKLSSFLSTPGSPQNIFLFTQSLTSIPNRIEFVVLFGIVGSQNSTQTQKHQRNRFQEIGGDRTANSRSKQGSGSAQGDFQTPVFVVFQQVASSSVNGAESDSSGQRRKRSFTGIANYSAKSAQS